VGNHRQITGGSLGRYIRPAPICEFDVGDRRSTWLELFFDLCFVAAVAALAHDP
jgi:low temperature requirement protein LtrA